MLCKRFNAKIPIVFMISNGEIIISDDLIQIAEGFLNCDEGA